VNDRRQWPRWITLPRYGRPPLKAQAVSPEHARELQDRYKIREYKQRTARWVV
jgi:hypothetical protein